MKENWTNDIKQKLEGHKMAPPAGLWEDISSEMSFPKKSASRRWYWLAAAVVLALVGFFGIYQFHQDESLPQVAQHTSTESAPRVATVTTNPSTPVMVCKEISKKTSQVTSREVVQAEPQEGAQLESQEEIQQAIEEDNIQVTKEEPQQTSTTTPHQSFSENQRHIAYHQDKQASTPSSASDWSIGLNASGGLLASADNNRTGRLYYPNAYAYQNGNAVSDTSPYIETDYVSRHHLPVRFGLSLHYQLSPTLSLLSGINYTYLYSEFNIPLYQNINYDQKLHYLGIPLGLSWQLLRSNGFCLYVSASAMLEKCLNEKPWQWSVNAATGAEYTIIPQLGLYLEPSLGYYFDDGTSFDHYYKEHPFAPSIEFGIRLHISK